MSPRPRMPLSVVVTAGLTIALAIAAAAAGAWTFAAWLALVGILPAGRADPMPRWGSALAYGSFGWQLLGLAPVAAGMRLEGPWGGPPWVFALALGANVLRVTALRDEATRRWAERDWSLPACPRDSVDKAIEAALRSPPESSDARVDAAVAALAGAEGSAVPTDPDARRAFWINVYNLLSLHASRGRRSARALVALEALRTVYTVAGRPLSVHAIEHGLLRNNTRAPYAPVRPLRAGDPRLAWAVPLDPRVHFALSCGALSCPPVRVYDAASLDAQLGLAEKAFVEGETRVDAAAGEVLTSRVFAWYSGDFGGRSGCFARIARVMGCDPATLAGMRPIYRSYDWRPRA